VRPETWGREKGTGVVYVGREQGTESFALNTKTPVPFILSDQILVVVMGASLGSFRRWPGFFSLWPGFFSL